MQHMEPGELIKYKILGFFLLIFTFFFTKEILFDIVDKC